MELFFSLTDKVVYESSLEIKYMHVYILRGIFDKVIWSVPSLSSSKKSKSLNLTLICFELRKFMTLTLWFINYLSKSPYLSTNSRIKYFISTAIWDVLVIYLVLHSDPRNDSLWRYFVRIRFSLCYWRPEWHANSCYMISFIEIYVRFTDCF